MNNKQLKRMLKVNKKKKKFFPLQEDSNSIKDRKIIFLEEFSIGPVIKVCNPK